MRKGKVGKKIKLALVVALIVAMISSSSCCLGPTSYNEGQQQALSLVSYLGYESLGEDSINHYSDQKVYENGVAGIMYKYGRDSENLAETVHDGLEEAGFAPTAVEVEDGRGWKYSWFSAVNGNIVTYVTTYFDGRNNYLCIAAGPDDYEEDVYKIRVESVEGEESDYVRLRSSVRFKSEEPKTIEHVAPLAGTIYAIKHPNNKLSGPQDAPVNIEAKRSYDEMLAIQQKVETNETYRKEFFNATDNETANSPSRRYYPWGFFWISRGGYYSPYRYGHYGGSGPIGAPRGTGQTIRGGGGPTGVK